MNTQQPLCEREKNGGLDLGRFGGSEDNSSPFYSEKRSIWENIKRLFPSIDGITGRKPVMGREKEEADIIIGSARSEDPAQYLQNGFNITEEELIKRVKKWIDMTGKLPQGATITECTFENRYYGPGGVLLENGEKGMMKKVQNHIPTQADWATFVIVKYTTTDGKKGEKEFALLCMNGLVREYEEPGVVGKSIIQVNEGKGNDTNKNQEKSKATETDYDFSSIENSGCLNTTMLTVGLATLVALGYNTCSHKTGGQDIEKEPKVIPQKSNIGSEGIEYIMPIGGSLMGTIGMTEEQAKKFAEDNGLKNYYTPDGKYIVIIQAGDVILEGKKGEYQLLRKREVHQN